MMSQVYEVITKTMVEDELNCDLMGCGADRPTYECGGSWSLAMGDTLTTTEFVPATGTAYVDEKGRYGDGCTADPVNDVSWGPWDDPGYDEYSYWDDAPRSLSFGTSDYEYRSGLDDDGVEFLSTFGYNTSASLTFRAPRQYGLNTVVVFTFEGLDYARPDGVALDLSKVKYQGQDPIAWSNEVQTVSYLISVNGGQAYTINRNSFQWPGFTVSHIDQYPYATFYRLDTLNELSWTNFHNAKTEIDIVGLDQSKKRTPGGLVVCNCDSNSPPRVQIIIQQLTNMNVSVVLTIPSQLKVFTASTNGTQVITGTAFSNTALPTNLWVEGASASSSMMDATLAITVNSSSTPADHVNFTVLWVTVSIQTVGTTPANAVQFGTLTYDGTENLGAKTYAGGAIGVGKVVPIAQLQPGGIGREATSGWAFRREKKRRDYVDGIRYDPDGLSPPADGWLDDTSDSSFQRLTPDSNDKIYDRDAPNVTEFTLGADCAEVNLNFHEWIEWNGTRASGGSLGSDGFPSAAEWHWRAKWQSSATPEVILKDVGGAYITLPSTTAGCP